MPAVKDFISVGDAKQTVEKPVKPKPSLSDLTTVETPGKPMPASQLEQKPRKSPRKKSRPKGEAKDITKKEYTLIITEKPQAALKIAQALGQEDKYSENKAAYYEVTHEGEKIVVASAVGHLFNLTYKKGQKGWPIFETEWEPSFSRKKAAFTKNYYNLLKKLAKKAKQFIIATDYDIEGEVIGWNVLRFICDKETAKRMKYSTLTKPELVSAFQSPMPELDWGHAYAGETRHILDWLYGINLSRALMSAIKTTGSFKILSIGRVQGPALKIIVDRELEIKNFKSEPYWQVFAIVENHRFKHPKDIFDKKDLDKFKDIKEANAETKKKSEALPPPNPFDLTSLQREAYRLYKMSPSGTLRTAQSLYLNGLISYPRTSSQKIPDEIQPKKILKALVSQFPEQIKLAKRPKPIEGKKSDPAHPSIYPTGEKGKMKEDEQRLYNIIAKRFISCFCPDAITENTRVTLKATKDPKITFTASGLKIKDPGWTQVYPATLEESKVPELSGLVKIDSIKTEEKETQPPRRYTPTSLITILEKKNLGTKATRSSIVDTLFDRGYLDGRSIKATPLGIHLIEALKKYSSIIIDENLTKGMEEEMEKIQESSSGFKEKEDKIVKNAEKVITDISKEFKIKEKQIGKDLLKGISVLREQEQEENKIAPCHVCKAGNLRITYSRKTKRYFVSCNNYPKCTFTQSLPPDALIKNTGKVNEEGLPILVAIKKGKRPWEFPFDVNWKEKQDKEKKD
ncbi:DNA topoisomerase I [Candidatus Pacearchaeota archaeon]|nr:DNA topoisomerase I [Candidatus Pacearchaeota archaeon]|tara:strand:- start:6821 stop:9043 length:2223 start_codon:yes stop_codon:yes gene_type:complete